MDKLLTRVELRELTDSRAVVSLPLAGGASHVAVSGELYGPRSATARTLAYSTPATLVDGGRVVEFQVTEPCYWAPQSPFLYEVRLSLRDNRGEVMEVNRTFGLRRLVAHGRNLRLQGERVVLRGAERERLDATDLQQARAAEMALAVPVALRPDFAAASAQGVLLAVDAGSHRGGLSELFDDLTWSPAVGLLLLDEVQLADHRGTLARLTNLLIAHCISADAGPETIVADGMDAVVVGLQADERPPAWLADLAKPVIARRPGGVYANLQTARAACDQLQAELAPQFNLAGYFV